MPKPSSSQQPSSRRLKINSRNEIDMTDTRRRRWSFSLRATFAVVTVLCLVLAWVAWSLSWIRSRHNAIQTRLVSIMAVEDPFADPPPRPTPPLKAPAGLWLFGEQPYLVLRVDNMNLESAKRLFPEA